MPSSSRVTITLSDELLLSLDEQSKRLGLSRGAFIRQVLAERLDAVARRDNAIDQVENRAKEHGLFESGVIEREPLWDRSSETDSERIRLPYRFLGKPVVIDPAAPRLELDMDGYPLLPGGYYANYCEACGESFMKHDDGECPEDS